MKGRSLPLLASAIDRNRTFFFGIQVSKLKETMMPEDPETTVERLYHERCGHVAFHADADRT